MVNRNDQIESDNDRALNLANVVETTVVLLER